MKQTKYLNAGAATLFVAVAYWLLAVKNGFMMKWIDEFSLFEPTQLFFNQFINYPGGLLRWAGTWLTQLMYYPWLGTTVLVALWLLLAWLTVKAFRLPEAAATLGLLVPLTLLVSVIQLDEAWLSLKSPGYVFSNTLGYLFTVGAVLLYRSLTPKPWISMAVATVMPLFYWFAGFYALLAGAICAILLVKMAVKEKRYILLAVAAASVIMIIIVPKIYYTYWPGNTVDNDYLYLKGLPELMMEKFDVYLWKPFVAATAFLLILAILSRTKALSDTKAVKWVSVAAVCAGIVWGVKADNKSEQLRATVLMLQHIDRNEWAGVSGVMSRIKEPPNLTMRALNNIALLHDGREWQSLKELKPRQGDGRHSEKFTMTAFVNIPMNYHLGQFNPSYRWAMEHTVQYGKRVFFLKYMMKDALMRGEIQLARRYNDILMSTMFHKEWAERMQKFIEQPELIGSNPEFQSIRQIGKSTRTAN